jgi:surface protein
MSKNKSYSKVFSIYGSGKLFKHSLERTSPTFEFTINTANLSAGSTTDTQFKLPLTTSTGLDAKVDWGDGTSDTITNHLAPQVTHTYPSSGVYTVKITGAILGWRFNNGGDKLKILNVSKWSGLNISVGEGFYGCSNLTATATDAPLITTTSLNRYFQTCKINSEIGNWNVSNVEVMGGMFAQTNLFNKDISSWDVSNVIDMQSMFLLTGAFNQDISGWDVSNVTNMTNMFNAATAFNQDIGSWNVSNVGNFNNFMLGKTAANYSAQNLASIYNQWSQLTLKPNLTINFNTIDYCDTSEANKQSIVTNFGWTISDGNAVPCP